MDDDPGTLETPDEMERAAGGCTKPSATTPSGTSVVVELLDPKRLLSDQQKCWIRSKLNAAFDCMQPTPAGEVRIKLIDDVEMMAAHQQYCGIGTTTDVLTFDMSDHGIQLPVRPLDVDLFVCVDEARRQGTARQFTVERETLLYCLHGVLHCLGYDDHDETDHDRMHAEEDRLLREIGVGVTFAVNAAEGKHTP